MAKVKLSNTEQVTAYMQTLIHPLKAEAEELRELIKASSTQINERIKWNAPSYYILADLVTFNFSNKKLLRLVFHHPAIVQIQSPILQGDYLDRRLVVFEDKAAVENGRNELKRVLHELLQIVNQ